MTEARRIVNVSVKPDLAPVPEDRDRALFLTGPNPFAPNSRFAIIAGTTTFGTGALSRHLFNHDLYRLTLWRAFSQSARWHALNMSQAYFVWRRKLSLRALVRHGEDEGREKYGQELQRIVKYRRQRRAEYWGLVTDVSVGMLGFGNVDEASVTPFEYSKDEMPSYRFDKFLFDGIAYPVHEPVVLTGVRPGQVIDCEITLRNIGGGVWTSDGNPLPDARTAYRLGTALARDHNGVFFCEGNWIEDHRVVEVGVDVLPNETVSLAFKLAAPRQAGRFHEDYQLVHELRTWRWGPYLTVVMEVDEGAGESLDPVDRSVR